jgi:hypothetical protein
MLSIKCLKQIFKPCPITNTYNDIEQKEKKEIKLKKKLEYKERQSKLDTPDYSW